MLKTETRWEIEALIGKYVASVVPHEFDCPHCGHLTVARVVYTFYPLDERQCLVCGRYFKKTTRWEEVGR